MKKYATFISLLLLWWSILPAVAQTEDAIPFSSGQWVIEAQDQKIEEYAGKQSLYLRNGAAFLKDVAFTNGIIEFDINFHKQRGFMGVMFRMADKANFEEFYLRSHQSGNPDAMQYTPVNNTLAAWQLYHGEGYSVAFPYAFDEWMHVKLVIAGDQGEVYINNMETPVLFMHDLKREGKPGMIGVKTLGENGRYANFTFTKIDNPVLKGEGKAEPATEPGTVTSWQISPAFHEKQLENKLTLTDADSKTMTWQKLITEKNGLANIATLTGFTKEQNTVFARVSIESDKAQVKKFVFGFSDRVKVFLNNQLLFSGNDDFTSRDYRFLGTIGYFDAVYLPLKKGKNELWLAVSETMGGWGLKGKFETMEGIQVK
ncbi:hypothetical protein Q0590_03555 [Rhodocytophaga aerolata]|uniref:3-keto-alpha-glucoside-1,2-lyase/3-keto-2-hydroxy-glucal hydratase domain-containing protein n=1 Tax=Rhodocytophaga aerolata TaxID=455078 RepID=A0ABT8R056_9BACT|nr:family 16 glycoside hydrolase [Rhodocytophaga aerolata]MDO1445309.1 hypothetical protein [Rhodocytophaga aerolata]